MTWYFLVRDRKIINEVKAQSARDAVKAFSGSLNPYLRSGDMLMRCDLKAETATIAWKEPSDV